jgi:thimet oligopeptidase
MMKSAKNAAEFIDRVSRIAAKRAQRDYQELLARKRKDVRGAKRVEDYEKSYYENKVKQESYQFDPQSVRPYFEYNRVEAGLLDITSRIYDIQYVKVTDAEVWHPSVKVFDVVRGDDKLGRIYLDMHPREGKYKHAAQFTVQSGVRGKQLPEGALVCNLPDPSKSEGPALMEHGDVVTMFHEFGHLMHHVLGGDQRYIEQSGVATEWDFVEAPSQMFEEWAWSHETLSRFAKHYETGAPIPAELVERMRRADKFGLGVQTVQQMFYASISLSFHTADPASLDMQAKVKELQAKYTPFRFVEGTSMHTNFGHLYGYSALYYTYMWSLVIAKDLLTPFHEHGLMNTEWTHRYRDKILVPGGTQDAAELVKDFLGRPYSFQAFEDYLSR